MQRKHFEKARDWQLGSGLGQFITEFRWALGMTGLRGKQARERYDHLTTHVCL